MRQFDARVEWIVPHAAPRGSRIFISGPPKTGKSFVATDLAVATATGTAFLSTFRTWSAAPVLLLTRENPRVVAHRIAALLRVRAEIDAPALRIVGESLSFHHDAGRIEAAIRDWQPQVVVVDTPADFALTYETSVALDRAAVAARSTVVLVGDLKSDLGASDWRAWADVVMSLRHDVERQQVLVSTEAREAAGETTPLIRFVICRYTGTFAQLVPWPAEPMTRVEMRIYDQLRRDPTALRDLPKLLNIRHSTLFGALHGLRERGLVEAYRPPFDIQLKRATAVHWRALPVTGRAEDDLLTTLRTTGEQPPAVTVGATTKVEDLDAVDAARLRLAHQEAKVPKKQRSKMRDRREARAARVLDGLPKPPSITRFGVLPKD